MASGRRGTATLTTDSHLYRRHYCVVIKNRGLESPRLFIFPSSRRFSLIVNRSTFRRFHSLLTTHRSTLIAQRRLEDAKPVRANSRGFLNPWYNWQDKEMASAKTRNGNPHHRFASLQTPLLGMLVIEIGPSERFRPLSFSSLLPICGVRAGVPAVFFGVRKCNPGSRRHFLASGNAIRGPDGTFWRQEMQSGVPTAFFGVRKCNPGSRQPFPAYPKDKKRQWVKVFQRTKFTHFACRATLPCSFRQTWRRV